MICFCTWFTLDRSICLVRIESNMKLSRQRQRQWKWTQREAENTKRHKFILIQILSTSPLLVYVFFLNLYFGFFQRCLMYLLTQNLLKFAKYKIVYNLDQILTFSTLQMVFIDFCALKIPPSLCVLSIISHSIFIFDLSIKINSSHQIVRLRVHQTRLSIHLKLVEWTCERFNAAWNMQDQTN